MAEFLQALEAFFNWDDSGNHFLVASKLWQVWYYTLGKEMFSKNGSWHNRHFLKVLCIEGGRYVLLTVLVLWNKVCIPWTSNYQFLEVHIRENSIKQERKELSYTPFTTSASNFFCFPEKVKRHCSVTWLAFWLHFTYCWVLRSHMQIVLRLQTTQTIISQAIAQLDTHTHYNEHPCTTLRHFSLL